MRVAIYARVSTDQQTVEMQVAELMQVAKLKGWTIAATHIDQGLSGALGVDKRPGFKALMEKVTRREVDMVAAWAVDRLGRSMLGLMQFMAELDGNGVNLYLHRQALDTSTPAGRALFGMLGIFAEFERALNKERTRAGLARAKAKGVRLGRDPLPADKVAQIQALKASGKSLRAIAVEVGVHHRTVGRHWVNGAT